MDAFGKQWTEKMENYSKDELIERLKKAYIELIEVKKEKYFKK